MQLSDLPLTAEATYQKQRGTLDINKNGIEFVPYSKQQGVRITVAQINRQLVNPDSSAKALIKVMIGDPEVAHTFQFHKDMVLQVSTPEAERAIRDKFKDAITLLIAKRSNQNLSANVSLDQFKARQQILTSDPQVRKLHAQLVIQEKQLSEEEFWQLPDRTALLETASYEKNLKRAVDGQFIDDKIRKASSSSKSGEMKFKLTEEIINNIFLHHPKIKQAYDDNVKSKKITEQEFWVRCLQSAFFSQDKKTKRSKKDDIFDQAFQEETEDVKKPSVASFLVDLNEQEDTQDYGGTSLSDATMKPGNVQESKLLFRKLNHHAEVVLGQQQQVSDQVPKHMQVLREMTQLDDLVPHSIDDGIHLNFSNELIKTTKKSRVKGDAKMCDNYLAMVDFRKRPAVKNYDEWKQQIIEASGYENPKSLIPADTYQELMNLNVTITELLKHFWTQYNLYKMTADDQYHVKAQRLIKVIKVHLPRLMQALGPESFLVNFDDYPSDGILKHIKGDSESEVSIKLLSLLCDSVNKAMTVM